MRIKLSIQIHSGFSALSSNDVLLYKKLVLPFIPYIGMNYIDEFDEYEVNAVYFNSDSEITVYLKSDMMFYNKAREEKNFLGSDYSKTKEFKERIQEYIDAGWEKK